MTTLAAYGIYPPSAALNDIVDILNHAGFVNEDICMMLSPSHPIAGMVREAGFHDSDRQTDFCRRETHRLALRIRRRDDSHGRFLHPFAEFLPRAGVL